MWSPRGKVPILLLLLSACGDDNGSPDAFSPRLFDGATPADAATSDASTPLPVPGDEECEPWEVGERPTALLPTEHSNEYVLELERWEIDSDSGDPVQTRTRMNEAIAWAIEEGFDKVTVPPGTYHLGEATTSNYAGGVVLPGDMTFELSEGAVLQMATNDRANYCVITVDGNDNVTIRGGEVIGDRADHVYADGGAHSEGHAICVWTAVDRILIEDMELHEVTGDGVLIVGRPGSDDAEEMPSTNITIRNNRIHHNRRQGVSVVGGHNVVIENNHIHHIEGSEPQFGVDIEGAGRTDRNILIFRNNFHDNAGGDIVNTTGRNVWMEENTMTQCQVNDEGVFDPSVPCSLSEQVDGPIIIYKETDSVIINNIIRMSMGSRGNGLWGILGYVGSGHRTATRTNPVGNYIAGNTLNDAGLHMAHNMRYFVSNNTINEGTLLGYQLGCTLLTNNRINRTGGESYKLRDVAGVASGNILNRTEGAPAEDDIEMFFPMANDAPYRNSSPVFW